MSYDHHTKVHECALQHETLKLHATLSNHFILSLVNRLFTLNVNEAVIGADFHDEYRLPHSHKIFF